MVDGSRSQTSCKGIGAVLGRIEFAQCSFPLLYMIISNVRLRWTASAAPGLGVRSSYRGRKGSQI